MVVEIELGSRETEVFPIDVISQPELVSAIETEPFEGYSTPNTEAVYIRWIV